MVTLVLRLQRIAAQQAALSQQEHEAAAAAAATASRLAALLQDELAAARPPPSALRPPPVPIPAALPPAHGRMRAHSVRRALAVWQEAEGDPSRLAEIASERSRLEAEAASLADRAAAAALQREGLQKKLGEARAAKERADEEQRHAPSRLSPHAHTHTHSRCYPAGCALRNRADGVHRRAHCAARIGSRQALGRWRV